MQGLSDRIQPFHYISSESFNHTLNTYVDAWCHKKRKDSRETRGERAVFSL